MAIAAITSVSNYIFLCSVVKYLELFRLPITLHLTAPSPPPISNIPLFIYYPLSAWILAIINLSVYCILRKGKINAYAYAQSATTTLILINETLTLSSV